MATSIPGSRRPALDGIRALAVLAVMVYHFGGGSTSVLPGGYLGVDAFFVLSGYLITGLLLAEHGRTGRIDLVAFWGRRVRRLLPAVLLVLLAVAAAVWWFGPVQGWAARRADLWWTLAYAANWHFAASGEDYFAIYTGASPLRHAWSLAVEEQFYLVWPLLTWCLLGLGAAARGRRRVAAAAAAGVVASAGAMAVLYDPGAPSRAYYGTDGRVQELGLGVALAVLLAGGRVLPRWAGWTGWAGAGVFTAALVLLPDTSPAFYRGGALVVCLAVALVIANVERHPRSRLARVLSVRPLVLLGVISYGVYLWHWPLVVFIPATGTGTAGWWLAQVTRTALTLGLATASFTLVERPVREGRAPWVGRSVPRLAVAAAAASLVVAIAAVGATRLPARYAAQLAEPSDEACPTGADGLTACVRVARPTQAWGPDGADTLVLFGDSTARAMDKGLRSFAAARGLRYVEAAWQRCTPTGLLVVPVGSAEPGAPEQACAEQARSAQLRVLDDERRHGRRPVVLLADFWVHHQPLRVAGEDVPAGTERHDELLRDSYTALVAEVEARGARTVLLTVPSPGPVLGAVVATGRPAGRSPTHPLGSANVDGYNDVLRQVADGSHGAAVLVDAADLVCPERRCAALAGDTVVRYDGVHYTAAYARMLLPRLMGEAERRLRERA
ncbi:MAG TPA: acyltransferase family protein [Dermatophilaceae bacterium]|nr:acyltransferase family protein [Dermatophilaceae bacterium]